MRGTVPSLPLSVLSNHDVPGFYAPSFRIIRERNERGPRNQISAEMCPWDTKAGQSFEGFVLGWRILLSCPDVSPEGLLNRGYNRPRLESSWRTMKSSECGSISRIEIFFSHRVARMSKLPFLLSNERRVSIDLIWKGDYLLFYPKPKIRYSNNKLITIRELR